MTVKRVVTPNRFIGLSTDTKLTQATDSRVRVGDTFYEYDTDLFYITYDGTNWVLKKDATDEGAWTFGEPTLFAARLADAVWARTPPAQVYQKSPSQWTALLNGGAQSSDDWASVVIPVNELLVPALTSAMWTYFMTNAESAGVNIVVWVHDPTDFSKRAEITQTMGEASKAAGFNKETLDSTATEMFFYGEGVTGNTTCDTAGKEYTWAQFQSDALFSTWTIYRITLDYGWLASSTLDDAWVTEISINGQSIVLKPDSTGTGRIGHRYHTSAAATFILTLAPKTPFRLLSVGITCGTVLASGELFTATVDVGRVATVYDHIIMSEDLYVGTRLNYFAAFGEGYDFRADDEIDFENANTGTDVIGLTVAYQTVFS